MTRTMRREDFPFVFELYMHPATNPYLLYEVMDEAAFEPIFNELLEKQVMYIYESEGVPTGMFKLLPQTYRAAHIAYLGGLAIHPDKAGWAMERSCFGRSLNCAGKRYFTHRAECIY
ncbi:hypothetical protein [Paraflavitalea speifideaquila]|uniref:hypothetical protein n=1 Tax=Paraflavitalea speifideaquila TaxID=3076558 RepID=UPI0028EBB728|nr:hypothetical protein [Paraflavitalea speifideiaquila]